MTNFKIYLSGPMRGIPQHNFPAFFEAAEKLRGLGYEVFNPAEADTEKGIDTSQSSGLLSDLEEQGFSLFESLGNDLRWICEEADGVALLPGWENSNGAKSELYTGLALGLLVATVDEFFYEIDIDRLTPARRP